VLRFGFGFSFPKIEVLGAIALASRHRCFTRIKDTLQKLVMPSGKEIVDVVVGETDSTADIKNWKQQQSLLEASQKFQGDKAYLG